MSGEEGSNTVGSGVEDAAVHAEDRVSRARFGARPPNLRPGRRHPQSGPRLRWARPADAPQACAGPPRRRTSSFTLTVAGEEELAPACRSRLYEESACAFRVHSWRPRMDAVTTTTSEMSARAA